MARLADVVFDCRHAASLARFWAEALDGYDVAPYDDDELARLASLGIVGPDDDPTVLVEPTDGGPRLWFQQVPEQKVVKNRLHLDIAADDLEAEVERMVGLGARVESQSVSDDLVVLLDPEGNEFCLYRA